MTLSKPPRRQAVHCFGVKAAVLAMQDDKDNGLDERGVMGAYFYLLSNSAKKSAIPM